MNENARSRYQALTAIAKVLRAFAGLGYLIAGSWLALVGMASAHSATPIGGFVALLPALSVAAGALLLHAAAQAIWLAIDCATELTTIATLLATREGEA